MRGADTEAVHPFGCGSATIGGNTPRLPYETYVATRTCSSEIIGAVGPQAVDVEIAVVGNAELSRTQHAVIPPEFAPAQWSESIERLVRHFPFEPNVFLMTRFPKDERETGFRDPVREVIRVGQSALRHHGLLLHLPSDRNADDALFGNIAGHIWACKYGISLFERRFGAE